MTDRYEVKLTDSTWITWAFSVEATDMVQAINKAGRALRDGTPEIKDYVKADIVKISVKKIPQRQISRGGYDETETGHKRQTVSTTVT